MGTPVNVISSNTATHAASGAGNAFGMATPCREFGKKQIKIVKMVD
jgi:hypothetical protein